MVPDAESRTGPVWQATQKNPRITRVGLGHSRDGDGRSAQLWNSLPAKAFRAAGPLRPAK